MKKTILFFVIAGFSCLFAFQNCAQPNASQIVGSSVQRAQVKNQPVGPGCTLPQCPAPPVNCNWVNPQLDSNKCPVNCGSLMCEDRPTDPILCERAINCAPPPNNCRYGVPSKDQNGCPTNCGELICDGDGEPPEVCPQAPKCPPPPNNCTYVLVPQDKNGCIIGCGRLACTDEGNGINKY